MRPSRLRLLSRSAHSAVLVLLVHGLAGCRTMEVRESQFFDARLATLPDSVRRDGFWPAEYTLAEHEFAGDDSMALYRILLDHPAADYVVLYFGGSNFQIGEDFRRLLPLTRVGVAVVAFDYPGYGRSGGTPSLASFRRAALAAYDEALRATGVPASRLVVHGHSLGTLLAMYVADHRAVGGVVLEGPATNAREWAGTFVPWYARPFVRLDIAPALHEDDNLERVRRLSAPLLILAGADDRDTKPVMARRLFSAAGTPASQKRLVVLDDTGHMILRSSPLAVDAYRAFIDEVLRRTDSAK